MDALNEINVSNDWKLAVYRDEQAIANDRPIDWPGTAIESFVICAVASVDKSFYEVNSDEAREIAEEASDKYWDDVHRRHTNLSDERPAIIAALDKHYDEKGWSHEVIDLSDNDVMLYVAMDASRYCTAKDFCQNELKMWDEGNCAYVELLHRHEWHDSDGNSMDTWDEVDSIGSVYINDIMDEHEVFNAVSEDFQLDSKTNGLAFAE